MSGDDSLSETLGGLSIRDPFRMPMPTVPTGAAVIVQPETYKTYEEMNEDERRIVEEEYMASFNKFMMLTS